MRMKNKKRIYDYTNIFLIGTIGYIFIIFLKISSLEGQTTNLSYLILDIFGNLNIESDNFMINYVSYINNFIVIMYVTSSYVYDEFRENAAYIFTRTNNRKGWVYKKLREILAIIIKYFLIQYVITILIGVSKGFKVLDVRSFLIIIVITFIHLILNLILISLITNISAFKLGNQVSYGIGAILISLGILIAYIGRIFFISNWCYKLIPFTNGITSWYGELNNIIDRNIYMFTFYIEGNRLITNIIGIVVLLIILKKILGWVVSNIEIL